MKNINLLFAFTVISLTVFAEGYQLSFTASGVSTSVDHVEVQNLSTGTTLTLSGDDILQLGGNLISTSVKKVNDNGTFGLRIYTNKSSQVTNSVFYLATPQTTNVLVSDMFGRILTQASYNLSAGSHNVELAGFSQGVYFLSVSTGGSKQVVKFISNAPSGIPAINYLNSKSLSEKTPRFKSKNAIVLLEDYIEGDRILLKANAGNHKRIVVLQPSSNQVVDFKFIECVDYDGNHYAVIQIGSQYWMAESLKTTRYNNGDLIGTTTSSIQNLTSETDPKYQWAYSGVETNAERYGRLYTWYVQNDSRGVCPVGWSVPSITEWGYLETAMGGATGAAKKMKDIGTTHWNSPNTGTNETGFSALAGGRRNTTGEFVQEGDYVWFLESTGNTSTQTNHRPRRIDYNSDNLSNYNVSKKQAGYIRCVKNVE